MGWIFCISIIIIIIIIFYDLKEKFKKPIQGSLTAAAKFEGTF